MHIIDLASASSAAIQSGPVGIAPRGVADSWDKLTSIIPDGLLTTAGVVGIAVAVISVVWWLLKRGKNGGSGMSGFPIWWVVGGGALATFTTFGGVIASFVDAVINIITAVFRMFVGWL